MSAPTEEAKKPQDLITEENVKKTLWTDKGKDAVLKSWTVVDFTKPGDNYACVVTSVEVRYSKDNSEQDVTYVVKLNPCRKLEGIEDMTDVIFMKEARFYLEIVPELNAVMAACGKTPLQLPRCFHAGLEKDNEQIFFEDLRVRDFKMFDRKKGMDESHTTLVLKELARLHAASYLLQAKTPSEPLEVKFDFLLRDWFTFTDNSKDIMLPMFQQYVTNSAEMLKKVGYREEAISWVEDLKPQVEDIITIGMQSEKFGSICHGDCWNNNILFRYSDDGNPVETMLLDLQICRKASLAADLNYFLYTSLTGSVRCPNINDFMSTYHSSYKDTIEAGGKDMYFTEEELMKEFRDKNKLGALFGMAVLPILLMESDEVPDFSGEINIEKCMAELKAKAMDMLDTNPLMKPRFLEIFDELTETGLIA